MTKDTREGLGQLVRNLRERSGLTQEELGRKAGYGTGAGVSISRLESGLLRPGPERLAGLAEALGLTSEELQDRAASTQPRGAAPSQPTDEPGGDVPHKRPTDSAAIKERAQSIQREIDERTRVVTQLSESFNRQHDRARDEFFMRFVEIAGQVEGAPQLDPTVLEDEGSVDADNVASYRLKANATGVAQLLAGGAGGVAAGAAVGGAAAYGTFVAAATFGTASTGAAISGLSGVAATNATLALLGGGTLAAGGAGVAGGTMLLASIVALPAVVLAAGGLLWMAKRNRKEQQELAAKLSTAEAELAATKTGFDTLQQVLPLATSTLDYIATHGGHALSRWGAQLGCGPLTWESLAPADQRRYQDFIEVAAAQLAVVTINVQGLLTTGGQDRDQLIKLAFEVLEQSDAVVRTHV